MKKINKRYKTKPVEIKAYQTDKEMIIHTLEGDMKASSGDYIITGLKGEQYPCKPDIFNAKYELITQSDEENKVNINHGELKND